MKSVHMRPRLAANMTPAQSAAARTLLDAARRDWWQPGHPDFGITTLDTESFALDAGGRRAKGRVPEPVLVDLPRPRSAVAAGGTDAVPRHISQTGIMLLHCMPVVDFTWMRFSLCLTKTPASLFGHTVSTRLTAVPSSCSHAAVSRTVSVFSSGSQSALEASSRERKPCSPGFCPR